MVEKISVALIEKSRVRGAPFSILQQFESFDIGNGYVSDKIFETTIDNLGVSLSASDLHVIYEKFGRDNDKIEYSSFCAYIEDYFRAVDKDQGGGAQNQRPNNMSSSEGLRNFYGGNRNAYKDLEIDPNLDPSHVDQWLISEASPKQKKEFVNVYDSLSKFKASVSDKGLRDSRDYRGDIGVMRGDRGEYRGEGSDIDDGGLNGYGRLRSSLRPPMVTDSITSIGGYSVGRSGYQFSGEGEYFGSPTRGGSSSPRGRSQIRSDAMVRCSTSPSKMGSIMWGAETPLNRKGLVPFSVTSGANSTWCCAVCLYVENPISASQCQVCDSVDYTKDKDFQVKEQCRNCTFLNGQYARECEMCGEPLNKGGYKKGFKR